MRQNKKILSKGDIEILYRHWGEIILDHLPDGEDPSEFCGITFGTLEKLVKGEVIALPVEKLISLFLHLNIDFKNLLPSDFVPSGSRQVEEVIIEVLNQYGEVPLAAIRKTLMGYFSVDESWANEKLFECLEGSDKFLIRGGKVVLTQSEN